jgi:hypothetical protein
MAIKIFSEAKLTDSEIFRGLNGWVGDQQKAAINLINSSKKLTVDDIETSYVQVKQLQHTLSRAALKSWIDGTTILCYNETLFDTKRLTEALPFMVFSTGGTLKAYIFTDRYVTKSKDGSLNLRTQALHDLLVGAFISLKMKNNDIVPSNQILQRLLMKIYTEFVYRILNKEYSVGADKIINDTLRYWTNRFFLTMILGSHDSEESKEKISKEHFNFINEMKYGEIKQEYDQASPSSISDLLDLVKTVSNRMNLLSLRTFVSNWVNYYREISMLAIDTLDYLIFMILCLQNGNPMFNISATEIVKEAKGINGFREELIKLI